jgi:hypothetical protein
MKIKNTYLMVFILLTVSVACILPFNKQYTQEEVDDRVQQTVQAYQTINAPTLAPTIAPPTATPLPTATQYVSPTATPKPCNQAIFISETVLDGTKFQAGESFAKSWRLQNTGTCTWNPNYKLVFVSGDQMSGSESIKLGQYVEPGEKVDLLVNLKAPSKSGLYTGYWALRSDEGGNFAQVFVTINVNEPFFAVTRVVLTSDPVDYSGVCPTTLTIKADITATTAGKVTYLWQRSDGVTSSTSSVKFSAKGTKTVQFDWDVDTTDVHWVKIYIDSPNHQWFGTLDIDVTCS